MSSTPTRKRRSCAPCAIQNYCFDIPMVMPPACYALSFTNLTKHPPFTTMTVPLPGLVFVRYNSAHYLWAYKGTGTPETLLYCAPLPNVNPDGSICFGSNRTDGQTVAETWQMFLDSPFNDHLVGGKSRQAPTDVRLVLVSLEGKRKYPLRDLVPLAHGHVTLDQVVGNLIRSKSL